MKHLTKTMSIKSIITLLMLAVMQTAVWAQEGGGSGSGSEGGSSSSVSVTRTTETTSSNWYTSPWVWVIGAAVFILLLVALLRGGGDRTAAASRTDKVTVTKTTSSDTDLV